jgi:ABC-type nitrate/sulfonate/bicarbonate transport system ATPase subunit
MHSPMPAFSSANPRDKPLLSVCIQDKQFDSSSILGHIEFSLEPSRFTVILGPSGSGKTTLLRTIAGLDSDFTGRVFFNTTLVTQPMPNVALMFQDVRLFPWMTVERNIMFAAVAVPTPRSATEVLRLVGLDSAILRLYPRQLSGGMAKRVALARALAGDPSVLLLDEPFSDLDTASKYRIYDLLVGVVQSPHAPVAAALVTHDISEAVYLADEIIVLSGRRPATISSTIPVTIPRPRRRDDPMFLRLCTQLMVAAISNVEDSTKPDPAQSGTP